MTYRIVSLPINLISKIPQSSYYTKKSQVAAFLSCLSAMQLDMMELLNALALAEGRGGSEHLAQGVLSSLGAPCLPPQHHSLHSSTAVNPLPPSLLPPGLCGGEGNAAAGILISSVNHNQTQHPALSPLPQPLGVHLGRQKGLIGTCPLSLGCFPASICPQLGAVGVEHPCRVTTGG